MFKNHKKDKIKAPSVWVRKSVAKKDTLPVSLRCPSPQFAQETFTARDDKHSDLRALLFVSSDTVMAVATDSHCDFLIPERTVKQYARQSSASARMNRVYSFVYTHYNTPFSKKQAFFSKNTSTRPSACIF